ncbi:MAG TPA: ankyrin repeat domain-containing protein, partial [Gammaproteobacteria bacterium]|nr:ankyrin repeat domain-containing protein [Gammaproteobacteria bacterium]
MRSLSKKTAFVAVPALLAAAAAAVLVAGIGGGAAKGADRAVENGTGGADGAALEDVNHRNADGSTPLQWAVYEGDAAKVRRLIDAGADVS